MAQFWFSNVAPHLWSGIQFLFCRNETCIKGRVKSGNFQLAHPLIFLHRVYHHVTIPSQTEPNFMKNKKYVLTEKKILEVFLEIINF